MRLILERTDYDDVIEDFTLFFKSGCKWVSLSVSCIIYFFQKKTNVYNGITEGKIILLLIYFLAPLLFIIIRD